MMRPDTGGEAMSKHSPDLPRWLGTARRYRSVEEPGRPGRTGKGQPAPNGPSEYFSTQSEGRIDEQDQPNHISFGQPPHLAFPDHVHRFVTLDRPPGAMEGPEPGTGVSPLFDGPVVLLHDVVQVRTGATGTPPAQFPLRLQLRDHLGVGRVPVHGDDPGPRVARNTRVVLEEARRSSRVTVSGQQKIDGGACGIDGAVQTSPLALNPNVRLIHPPGAVGRLQLPAAALVQLGRVILDPTPDSGVVGGEAPLREEFLDVPIGTGESQVPAHRTGDDGGFEVAPFEQGWPWFAHKCSISGPRQPPPHGFATLPLKQWGLNAGITCGSACSESLGFRHTVVTPREDIWCCLRERPTALQRCAVL